MKKSLLTGLISLLVLSGCVSSKSEKDAVNLQPSPETLMLNGVWHCSATDIDSKNMLVKTEEQYDFNSSTGKYFSSGFVSISLKGIYEKPIKTKLIRFQKGEWKIKENTIIDTSYYSKADFFPLESRDLIEKSKVLAELFTPFRDTLNRTSKESQVLFIDNLTPETLNIHLQEKTKQDGVVCKKIQDKERIYPQLKEPLRSNFF